MFNWLTHSKTRLRMLKMFFKDMETPLYGLEIAQTLKASPGTTHRELNAMLKQGVLKKKKEGALVMYRLNTSHPYFNELRRAVFPKKKGMKRVLFLSDLHLSNKTKSEIVEDFQLFLDYAEDNASEIVFVGDMVESLAGDLFQVFLLHKPLFDRVSALAHDLKITYLIGNHDYFLRLFVDEDLGAKLFDSKINFKLEYINTKLNIYAAHGHHYDDYSEMKGKAKRSKYPNAHKLAELLKDQKQGEYTEYQSKLLALADVADEASKFAQFVCEKKIDFSDKFQKIAKELVKVHNYSYVVFGHTHKAQLKHLGHGIYFNAGSWKSEKKRQFVEIDNEGGALVSMKELK